MAKTSTWKNVERDVCRDLGGDRRGADYKQKYSDRGKNDCIETPGLSVEIKYNQRPTYGLMLSAVDQAISSKENEGDLPIAVIKKHYQSTDNALVIMRFSEFKDLWRKYNERLSTD